MSTLNSKMSDLFRGVLDLIFPPICIACHAPLTRGQRHICTACRFDIPYTRYWLKNDNPMAQKVRDIRPEIGEVSALFYFHHNSVWQSVIHDFKYHDLWYGAQFMGEMLGQELSESELYGDIDFVVAIPLHIHRQMSRGYNQSDYIAKGVAKMMSIPHRKGVVKRTRSNSAQALKRRHERWRDVDGLFEVVDSKVFDGRNVLLVDDVFTTGATIISCAEAILSVAPTCRVSIATLAVAKGEM